MSSWSEKEIAQVQTIAVQLRGQVALLADKPTGLIVMQSFPVLFSWLTYPGKQRLPPRVFQRMEEDAAHLVYALALCLGPSVPLNAPPIGRPTALLTPDPLLAWRPSNCATANDDIESLSATEPLSEDDPEDSEESLGEAASAPKKRKRATPESDQDEQIEPESEPRESPCGVLNCVCMTASNKDAAWKLLPPNNKTAPPGAFAATVSAGESDFSF